MSPAQSPSEPEIVYSYTGGPLIELFREPLDSDRFMHWLVLQGGTDGVAVVVSDGVNVLLQRQYRKAADSYLWQFPRGFGDGEPGTTVLDDGKRELLEETGIDGATLTDVGLFYPDSGILTVRIRVVEALVEELGTLAASDKQERISAYAVVPITEIDSWIARGDLIDGITLAALQVWRASAASSVGR
jgi:8-oxo-dGTP pyrophosphatase MutT (NUDIX family)